MSLLLHALPSEACSEDMTYHLLQRLAEAQRRLVRSCPPPRHVVRRRLISARSRRRVYLTPAAITAK
ncbi:MAG: hypothetical protein OHK0029_35110 [Armatimonadaceae bacterium]